MSTVKHLSGDDVRADDPDDKILVATREFWLSSNISLRKNDIVRYNGKSVVFRPCGYDPEGDQESTDITAVEYGLRRGWLIDKNHKPITTHVREAPKKIICWFNGLSKRKNTGE